jgi:hypothetical protein
MLAAIASLHAACGLGWPWPCQSEQVLLWSAGGTPGAVNMNPPASCVLVAAPLAALCAWLLSAVGLLPEAWPRWLTELGGAGIATVLMARGVASYTQTWRGWRGAGPFASLDRRSCTPRCLALGAGDFIILLLGGAP